MFSSKGGMRVTFHMLVGQGSMSEYGLLVINMNVLQNPWYKQHPVVQWLTSIALADHPIWLPER